MKKKRFSGLTNQTPDRIALDAGAFFIGFDVNSDTYATAKEAGKILGATQGGGEFSAKANLRQIAVDGSNGRVRGLTDVTDWEVYIKATIIETTVGTIRTAIAAAKVTAPSGDSSDVPTGYTKIEGKATIDDDDYIDNITWVGNISGSDKPIIIQIKCVLNEDGFKLAPKDGDEAKISVTFYGYNSLNDFVTDTVEPPFAIYYPDLTPSTPASYEEEQL